jgi:hypothetical protein
MGRLHGARIVCQDGLTAGDEVMINLFVIQ